MMSAIAIIAPGAMGAAVAHRLSERGATVLTSLAGRSAETIRRAEATGMVGVDDGAIVEADVILSIVPPAEAVALAERFAGPLSRARRKPIFADCNAVNVETVRRIASVIAPTGAPFVDGGIIGSPPGPASDPTFYFSGEPAQALARLADFGLKVRVMTAPVGGASALKMSYAGINKGVTLLAAAMILGATRAGAAEALHAELSESQPQLLGRLARSIPDMYPKIYRWAAEMDEIAEFLGDDPAARHIYEGMAALCRHWVAAQADGQAEIAALDAFVARSSSPQRSD
ncbi:NAD(P)-dependent oxidoreductase [Methylocapsa sp. S129]|uniref:NAD(P)-dependent oxidoreductase n=1 Tax=Methylocapsa sp. S129 TaxID=1641869 RepID=UPI00131AF390|nr:NAD(P)-dependent oxidoreductase [Methylocapsa sp. S129]